MLVRVRRQKKKEDEKFLETFIGGRRREFITKSLRLFLLNTDGGVFQELE